MTFALSELSTDPLEFIDVCIESVDCLWYRIDDVAADVFDKAVNRALSDGTTFSLLNTEGAALVVPWRAIRSLSCADVAEELDLDIEAGTHPDDQRTWLLVWERVLPVSAEPAPVFQ